MNGLNEVNAVIRQITADRALVDVGGTTVPWPRQALPDGAKEGDSVRLRMLTETAAEADQQELARVILAEILGRKS